ncbi:hypothetical protein [Zongyangia hominis]|uniref:Uncharacterized protein n=1 Tax=Zongyangia hominis TaxID=2763677 RepID=A0A926EAV8_9FIRM|nr:hypothetical protein [Zongyangia hominis]MBC8570517.1 hypothetical protein [Zongyangia hominis]
MEKCWGMMAVAQRSRKKLWIVIAVILILLTLIPIITYVMDNRLSGEDALDIKPSRVVRISVRRGDSYYEITDRDRAARLMDKIQGLSFKRNISLDEKRTLGNTIIEVETDNQLELISEINNRFVSHYQVPFLTFLTTYYDVENTETLQEIVALAELLAD